MYCHDILDIYDVESGLEQNDHNWVTALTSKPRVQILPAAHKGSIVDTNVISFPRGYVLVKLSVKGVAMHLVRAAVASHDFFTDQSSIVSHPFFARSLLWSVA